MFFLHLFESSRSRLSEFVNTKDPQEMPEEIKTARSLQNLLVKALFFFDVGHNVIFFLEALGSQGVGFSQVDFYKRQVVFGWPMYEW